MAGKYALLIGASTFGSDGPEALAAPEQDAAALRAVLTDPAIAGFAAGDVKFALNAGLERTQELIQWLFHGRARDDLLLLYYTGHGFKDPRDGELYLALPGTKARAPAANSLLASWVKREIGFSASARKLVILDSCFSGAFGAPEGTMKRGDSAALEQETFSPKGYGTVTLASSAAGQVSFELGGQSLYTRALVDALATGAADPEAEEVTVNALHDYLSERMRAETTAQGALMEPVCYAAVKTPLVIARNPNPRRPLDKELLDALRGQDPERIELAAFKLGLALRGDDERQAEDARRALAERLRAPGGLPYAAGKVIEDQLRGQEAGGAADGGETDDLLVRENARLTIELDALRDERESRQAGGSSVVPHPRWMLPLGLFVLGVALAVPVTYSVVTQLGPGDASGLSVAQTESLEKTIERLRADLKSTNSKLRMRDAENAILKAAGQFAAAATGKIGAVGLVVATLTPDLRAQFELDDKVTGVLVTEVDPTSNSAAKGVRPGDVIVEVDQNEVNGPGEIAEHILKAKEDGFEVVTLLVFRKDSYQWIAVKMSES